MKEVQELVGIVPWTFVAQICNLFLTVFLVKKFLFDRINTVSYTHLTLPTIA